jgi:predicted HTH domain antitoxin
MRGDQKMSTIRLTVDESVSELLGDSPEQVERAALEIIVLDLYRRHVISGGRAAEILNLDLLTFIRWSGSRGIPYFDMSDEQWDHEVQSINKA